MTKRIYCDNHLPSALEDCPRCIEEKNKKLQAVVNWAEQNSFLINSYIKGRGDDTPILAHGDYGIICVHADRYAIIPREDFDAMQAAVDAIRSMPKQYVTNCHITGRSDEGCPIRPYGNVFSVQMDRYRILPMEDFERLQSVVDAARDLRDFENSDAPMNNMEDDIHREELILAVVEAVCALDGEK